MGQEQMILNPEKLQDQIDEYKTKNDETESLKYEVDIKTLKLNSINKLSECINEFNQVIKNFYDLSVIDIKNVEYIKAEWMKLDEDRADKLLINDIKDGVNSLFD